MESFDGRVDFFEFEWLRSACFRPCGSRWSALGFARVSDEGFSVNLGRCSITRVEIRTVLYEVEMAWKLGIRKLEIQMDSECVVSTLTSEEIPCNQHASLLAKFQRLHATD